MKIIRNKKGLSLAEMIAAIAIIGLASSTITAAIINSYKGQIRAQEYLLANEVAKSYDAMLVRDITKENMKNITLTDFTKDADGYYSINNTTTANKNLLKKLTIINLANNTTKDSPIYNFMFGEGEGVEHLKLNGKDYDGANVTIRILIMDKDYGYFKSQVTVSYSNDRQVTYDGGAHFK